MSVQHGFNVHHLAAIDAAIGAAIAAHSLPGAVYWLERGAAHAERAYGRLDFGPAAAPVTVGTVFDVASLTKVLVTAPAILLLHEAGQIDLEAPLLRYLPECAGGGKDAITVRQLLIHTSGLLAGLPASPAWEGREEALLLASLERVTHVPGSVFRYSDINYILLGLIIERVAGMPLDAFAEQRIFAPLGMQDTGYRPLARGDGRTIAPTQRGAVEANAVLSKA
jgi:CubicO group peptidase (beta-lactamase class C family)